MRGGGRKEEAVVCRVLLMRVSIVSCVILVILSRIRTVPEAREVEGRCRFDLNPRPGLSQDSPNVTFVKYCGITRPDDQRSDSCLKDHC